MRVYKSEMRFEALTEEMNKLYDSIEDTDNYWIKIFKKDRRKYGTNTLYHYSLLSVIMKKVFFQ